MVESMKGTLKRFPLLVRWVKKAREAKAALWEKAPRVIAKCDTRVIEGIPMFVPGSSGSRKSLAQLGLQSANQTFPRITDLISLGGTQLQEPVRIESFVDTEEKQAAAEQLEAVFERFGSDKARSHYHLLYGSILSDPVKITDLLEVGLGTNNPEVVSHMGKEGRPGASLRAFREFLPEATLYGADIDKDILFQEDRIKTFFVDQTAPQSFELLGASIAPEFDLIIDDGLHAPDANIATLTFGLERLKVGGWLVVEDIPYRALPVWQVIATLLPNQYESQIIDGRWDLLFSVRRLK
jgi:hypothetical protein